MIEQTLDWASLESSQVKAIINRAPVRVIKGVISKVDSTPKPASWYNPTTKKQVDYVRRRIRIESSPSWTRRLAMAEYIGKHACEENPMVAQVVVATGLFGGKPKVIQCDLGDICSRGRVNRRKITRADGMQVWAYWVPVEQ